MITGSTPMTWDPPHCAILNKSQSVRALAAKSSPRTPTATSPPVLAGHCFVKMHLQSAESWLPFLSCQWEIDNALETSRLLQNYEKHRAKKGFVIDLGLLEIFEQKSGLSPCQSTELCEWLARLKNLYLQEKWNNEPENIYMKTPFFQHVCHF